MKVSTYSKDIQSIRGSSWYSRYSSCSNVL